MSSKPKSKRTIKCQHCKFKGNQYQIGLHYKSKPAHAPPRVQRRMGYQTDGQKRNEARVAKGGKPAGRPPLAHNGPDSKPKQSRKPGSKNVAHFNCSHCDFRGNWSGALSDHYLENPSHASEQHKRRLKGEQKGSLLTPKAQAISQGLKRFHAERRRSEQATSHTPIQVQDLLTTQPRPKSKPDTRTRTRTGAWNYCPHCGFTIKEQL